jgi:hypothetical protein
MDRWYTHYFIAMIVENKWNVCKVIIPVPGSNFCITGKGDFFSLKDRITVISDFVGHLIITQLHSHVIYRCWDLNIIKLPHAPKFTSSLIVFKYLKIQNPFLVCSLYVDCSLLTLRPALRKHLPPLHVSRKYSCSSHQPCPQRNTLSSVISSFSLFSYEMEKKSLLTVPHYGKSCKGSRLCLWYFQPW